MNKVFYFLLMTVISTLSVSAGASKSPEINRIDPPFWWTDMAEDTLQLMVYGTGISEADVTFSYPGVTLEKTVRPDSKNYLFVYLVISDEAQPGTIDLTFSIGRKKTPVPYELKKRDRAPKDYAGFDSSDVLYLIMPDRFAKGSDSAEQGTKRLNNKAKIDRTKPNSRHGGDIAGIKQHLDYIDSLGVTAIWVNPVLTNDMPGGSYHGYATTDYYSIDPRFGTNEEWNDLVGSVHSRKMKMIMDMIFNHCGSSHPWIGDMPTHDWLNFPDKFVQTNYRLTTLHDPYVSNYDLARTVDGWFVESMPDLNQRNPLVMKYLIQNSIWWIENSKIDGIRMDTHPYADFNGMASWIKAVEKEYPNFNIVGECWYENEGSEAFWQKNSYVNRRGNPELPTVMDFILSIKAPEAFGSQTDRLGGLNAIYNHLSMDFLFPDPSKILTFLDNHDTDRYLREMPEDLGSWKQAIAFLLTSRGIPQIYYGTEILMNGTKEKGDGLIRLDMPGGFPGDTTTVFTSEGRSPIQNEAFDFISKLLKIRKDNPAISKGSLKHFMPESGLYTYERKIGDDRIIVMMNGNDSDINISMEPTQEILPYGSTLIDLLTGEEITISPEMTFPPRALYILKDNK